MLASGSCYSKCSNDDDDDDDDDSNMIIVIMCGALLKCNFFALQSYPELGLVWAVGQRMWQRDFPGIYESLRKDWSESLKPIMDAIRGLFRLKIVLLLLHIFRLCET